MARGGNNGTRNIQLTVEIKTRQGTFYRSSAFHEVDTLDGVWTPKGGVIVYPDRRAVSMSIAEDNDQDGNIRPIETIKLSPSETLNYAFAIVDDGIEITTSGTELPEVDDVSIDGSADREIYGNRVKASETNQPFLFKADKTYYPGKNTDDQVVEFAINSLPVSTGQFGQYPLFVMCKESIWALEQSSDELLAFGRVAAYSLTHGVNHRKASANIDRSIAFINGTRIYLLGGGDIREIGKPVQDILSGDEKLAYYNQDGTAELWVMGTARMLVYNVEYGAWYIIERGRKDVIEISNDLYSMDAGGQFWDEHQLSNEDVNVSLSLQPVHYGQPDILKRLWNVILRGVFKSLQKLSITFETTNKEFSTTQGYISPRHASDFSYRIEVAGVMTPGTRQYIEGFDSEFEVRYPGRRRRVNTTPESTPPSLMDSSLTTPTVTGNAFTVQFSKATDTVTASSALVYTLYISTEDTLGGDIDSIISNAESHQSGTDVTELEAAGLQDGTDYYFNVVVENDDSLGTAYSMSHVTTLDNTPPNITSASLEFSSVTGSGFIVEFDKATDAATPQTNLTYKLYVSDEANLTSVSDIEANGILTDYGTDVSALGVSGLTRGEQKYVNVMVLDAAGNKAAYQMATQITADLTINSIVVENEITT